MKRLRGRPKRGSPWKPRRPPVTPPSSSSSEPTRPPQPAPRLDTGLEPVIASSATPSRSPNSLQRHPLDSMVRLPSSPPLPGPSNKPPRGETKRIAEKPLDSSDTAFLRDQLRIMNDLVFELRREMADLNYRLQASDAKVERCIHLLSSMQGAISGDQAAETPRQVVADDTSGPSHSAQRPVSREPAGEEKDSRAKGVARNVAS